MNNILPNNFWGITVGKVLGMEFSEIVERMKAVLPDGMTEEQMVTELSRRKLAATNEAEEAACNRILSAFVNGPDTLDC